MSRTLLISLLALCLVAPAANHALAQDKRDKQTAQMEKLKAKFVKDKEAAKQKVLNQFDSLIQKAATSKALKAADGLSLAENLRAERKVFAEKEDVPENTAVLTAGWQYGTAVVKAYKPVSDDFDQVMRAYIKAGKTDEAEKIKADKEKFDDEHLPGRKHFTGGAAWNGTQYEGTNGTLFRFQVTELQGSLFKARVEKNLQVGGHPIFDVGGSLDGILIQCKSLIPVQGNVRLAQCNGIVLGQTILLELTTVPPKGRATTSYAVLRKK
jgi:hypothetical protein